MPRSISNLRPLESIKIKHDVDRGVSMANSNSTEDYHGVPSVAIPFDWESQPGTPKVNFRRENALPPLTPPPSYFYTTSKRPTKNTMNRSKYNLLNTIFPKRATRKATLQISPASFSSSSSSQSSTPRSPSSSQLSIAKAQVVSHCATSSPRKSYDSERVNEEADDDECTSPLSTLCSHMKGRGVKARSLSLYASMIKVLLKAN